MDKDRQGTAQRLELPARPLMRLHSQGLIQGGHLRCLASVGAPSDPAAPLDWPKEACDLALRKAFTVQARPTQRAAGPGRRVPGTFGQLGFDEVHGERGPPATPPRLMRTGNGRPRPRSVDVAPRDHWGVCCREGIASGIGLLWNPWRRNPQAYRMFVAMPALPALQCPAPV